MTTALEVDDLSLDLVRDVKRGERKVELTQKEFALLEYFMRNAGIALTRTQILDQVWQYDWTRSPTWWTSTSITCGTR